MITTTTTAFKRAMTTITGILSASVLKTYDVGIQLHYSGSTGSVMLWNPESETVASANFTGEPLDEDVDILFYLGDLLDDLKRFRKKEPLHIDMDDDTIFIQTDDVVFYENELDDDRIHVPSVTRVYEMNRQRFIELLNIAQTVTKTTFAESSMSVQLTGFDNKVHVLATNLAQFMEGNVTVNEAIQTPFTMTLDAKEITKVRNVLSRGSGENVSFYVTSQTMVLTTKTTRVMFKGVPNIQHIDINAVFKHLDWEKDFYSFPTKDVTKTVKEQYDRLLDAEKAKDTAQQEVYKVTYIAINKDTLTVTASESDTGMYVATRDLHTICNKLPDGMEVAVNSQCVLLNHKVDERQVMMLIPLSTK